ncbi:hypothetical protein [Streptomyces sp. NBC_00233]|uniref:hypothetical protein n=1 Tax=Streptomyces sp. NBC_00233 TaxID=2975686 RepID=UPI00225371E5|nr:hypothetical protein [Streptomyces sp. NBC_00233]MCX5232957.1 hypothetical protein [Streptomyces sp. NBC_00233]
MSDDSGIEPRMRLAALADLPLGDGVPVPAGVLQQDAALLGRLLAGAAQGGDVGDRGVSDGDVAAALTLFEGMRTALDRLETQVVIEARRRGMEWRRIASHQGMRSSQAASQRYQRLVTRLEEIRQGIR